MIDLLLNTPLNTLNQKQEGMIMLIRNSRRGNAQIVFSAFITAVFGLAALGDPFIARADTPAQAQTSIQAICNHTAASYARRDLAGFMAQYSPNFTMSNVTGRKQNFQQLLTSTARAFARPGHSDTAHCTIARFVLQGSQARAVLHWHYLSHSPRSSTSPGYTIVRDYEEQTIWKKSVVGWQETSADIFHDIEDYKR